MKDSHSEFFKDVKSIYIGAEMLECNFRLNFRASSEQTRWKFSDPKL